MNVAAAIVLLSAAPLTLQRGAPAPVRVVGPTYEGAIISGEAQLNSDPRHLIKATAVWTPTAADVRQAEELLPAYLASRDAASALGESRVRAELPRYKRQYWGVVRRGRLEILIHFYHEDTSVGRKRLWLQGMVAVSGGGDQFFRITYQPNTKRFTGLQINAPE